MMMGLTVFGPLGTWTSQEYATQTPAKNNEKKRGIRSPNQPSGKNKLKGRVKQTARRQSNKSTEAKMLTMSTLWGRKLRTSGISSGTVPKVITDYRCPEIKQDSTDVPAFPRVMTTRKGLGFHRAPWH